MKLRRIRIRACGTLALAVACGVVAIFLPGWKSELHAKGYYESVVTISGDLSVVDVPELRLHLQVRTAGLPGAQTGQGESGPSRGDKQGKGVSSSRFPLTGYISGNVVTLGGGVEVSSDPSLIFTPVLIEADESTGLITLNFGELVLTGTGSVHIQ
jgi:hypothetical protein